MEAISGYILNIVGIIMLGVLINIIMPEGNMSKYINNIFALFVVFVIISPIPSLLNYELSLEQIVSDSSAQIDESLMYVINAQTVEQLELSLECVLEDYGYAELDFKVDANIFESPLIIQKITIDLSNLVINSELTHINKYSKIKEIVLNNVLIEEEKIVFYE